MVVPIEESGSVKGVNRSETIMWSIMEQPAWVMQVGWLLRKRDMGRLFMVLTRILPLRLVVISPKSVWRELKSPKRME